MSADSDFKSAADRFRINPNADPSPREKYWTHPLDRRVDVTGLPICPKEKGGCGHYVLNQTPPACYDANGIQQPCACVCDLYLPRNGGCANCGE